MTVPRRIINDPEIRHRLAEHFGADKGDVHLTRAGEVRINGRGEVVGSEEELYRLLDQVNGETCECVDRECPVHRGWGCPNAASTALRRVDMDGEVQFCEPCANDALESGVFAER